MPSSVDLRVKDEVLDELARLHGEVDDAAAQLEAIHRDRLTCTKGCFECCIDEITVFEIEAARIVDHAPSLLRDGTPHPVGGCALLSAEGACRIYEVRPYVCRTQGLPLRWISERGDGTLAELRDICHLNEEGEPVEELPRASCWTIGPVEERLGDLQRSVDGGERRRVRLRDLFNRQA